MVGFFLGEVAHRTQFKVENDVQFFADSIILDKLQFSGPRDIYHPAVLFSFAA